MIHIAADSGTYEEAVREYHIEEAAKEKKKEEEKKAK